MSGIVSKSYWEDGYSETKPQMATKADVIRCWIEKHVPIAEEKQQKTAIEIGCYPGRYLSVLGDLGYETNGIDFCKQVETLPKSMKEAGYRVGEFWKEDFEKFQPGRKFDVVASFGFIEHFDNFEDIVLKHADLVNNQGYLVLEVPNFYGAFQHWLHRNFDNINYKRHFIPAMNIERLADVVDRAGYDVLYKGYFGQLDFWTEHQERGFFQKGFLTAIYFLRPFFKKILPIDRRMYSPFGGMWHANVPK